MIEAKKLAKRVFGSSYRQSEKMEYAVTDEEIVRGTLLNDEIFIDGVYRLIGLAALGYIATALHFPQGLAYVPLVVYGFDFALFAIKELQDYPDFNDVVDRRGMGYVSDIRKEVRQSR